MAKDSDYSRGLPSEAETVCVPHTYNVMSGLEYYAGKAWYEKRVLIPEDLKGRHFRLMFEAVYHDAVVFVNGNKVGEHIGKGYTPFSFDVTSYLRAGEENLLTVEVDNSTLSITSRTHVRSTGRMTEEYTAMSVFMSVDHDPYVMFISHQSCRSRTVSAPHI